MRIRRREGRIVADGTMCIGRKETGRRRHPPIVEADAPTCRRALMGTRDRPPQPD
ncbi:hypothetical protein B1M_06745 [Burkholderia sp. TJI49]|nr:hypothetical protein B1M_06745 [Burkholderia sp. TJI49]